MTLSNYVLDNFIAPGMSKFTQADIPDMSGEPPASRQWITPYILKSVFRGRTGPPDHEYRFNYMRRVEAAFLEHDLARSDTTAFLHGMPDVLSRNRSATLYFAALLHWEQFVGATWHALLTMKLIFFPSEPLYAKGDDSIAERVNKLYNQMKHSESRIENGQMPPEGPVPVWLCNEGIESPETLLTFAETGDILSDIAEFADALVDPLTTLQRLADMPLAHEQADRNDL